MNNDFAILLHQAKQQIDQLNHQLQENQNLLIHKDQVLAQQQKQIQLRGAQDLGQLDTLNVGEKQVFIS